MKLIRKFVLIRESKISRAKLVVNPFYYQLRGHPFLRGQSFYVSSFSYILTLRAFLILRILEDACKTLKTSTLFDFMR